MQVTGGCHCGNVRVSLELPRPTAEYSPRACDCDFCRKHAAAYISDAKGALSIAITDERELARYRQGSETAEFLVCRRCGVLVAVTHDGHATVNARVVDAAFAAEQAVSPKQLSAEDKVKRWQQVWFADVTIG
jgi:hypothetical protein